MVLRRAPLAVALTITASFLAHGGVRHSITSSVNKRAQLGERELEGWSLDREAEVSARRAHYVRAVYLRTYLRRLCSVSESDRYSRTSPPFLLLAHCPRTREVLGASPA